MCRLFPLPLRDGFTDQIEIFLVELLLFLALLASLALFSFAFFGGVFVKFLVFDIILIDDKALADLCFRRISTVAWAGMSLKSHLASLFFIVVIFIFLAGIIHVLITSCLCASLASVFVKRVIILLIVQLGLADD